MSKGDVTLPAEAGQDQAVIDFCRKWGADAIRDSDGTQLSAALLELGFDVYSTVCLVRADQAWAKGHMHHLPRKFLMSKAVTARTDRVEIDPMDGYFDQKYQLDTQSDPKKYWEVIDRTTGQLVDVSSWDFDAAAGRVIVRGATAFHQYTVSFMVCQVWDSTSMYNHLTNNWTGEHTISVDPYHRETYEHLMAHFDAWLAGHKDTDVVRLTTLAYHFTNDTGPGGAGKYRDWQGYTDTISPAALEDFAREKGYRLRAEDFIDEGYYNATDRVASPHYLDWMDFVQKFIVRFGKDLVDRVHRAGKKAGIFWGDHWIGVEPYSDRYQEMGIDINIGAVGDGVSLRRLADAPGGQYREARFYPYFFPDVFHPGGDPTGESVGRWVRVRRAMLRNCVDRIGYGGYLSLAAKFPDFVDHVSSLCDEFRAIKSCSQVQTRDGRPAGAYRVPLRVGVLTAWGKLRSWINDKGVGYKFRDADQSNVLECLAGLPVDVQFIGMDDIERDGVPVGIDVIVNNGQAGTAWSGGRQWTSAKIVAAIRQFVDAGGGFVGVTDPSACEYQGRFFQLSDVLGVQKEVGQSLGSAAVAFKCADGHFITDDRLDGMSFGVAGAAATAAGRAASSVYVCEADTQVLAADGKRVLLAARQYGTGRSAYLAGLPYSVPNARLLLRTLLWTASKESQLRRWFSSNPETDCAAYLAAGRVAVVNNVGHDVQTVLYDGDGQGTNVSLKQYQCLWYHIENGKLIAAD